MNVHSFAQKKTKQEKISMVTCYDHWSAKILNETEIDCILVGDSLAVVMHGFDSTVHATLEMMELHVAAVARGAPDKFIVADMPFMSCSKGLEYAMEAVQRLMQAGANAVKIEGDAHQIDIIQHIVEAGVPVMGHLGLTPQSIHNLGGHKVQAKADEDANKLIKSAKKLQQAGCFSVVLECIPTKLVPAWRSVSIQPSVSARVLTRTVNYCSARLARRESRLWPKFHRAAHSVISSAVDDFHSDVVEVAFPGPAESYR